MRAPLFAKLRRFAVRWVHFPLARYRWAAALDAWHEDRWSDVANAVELMHASHWDNDGSHYVLGCAYVGLERWREAVREFEQIEKPLETGKDEEARRLNHALALSQIGQARTAFALLPDRAEIPTVFPSFVDRALEMYDDLKRHLDGLEEVTE